MPLATGGVQKSRRYLRSVSPSRKDVKTITYLNLILMIRFALVWEPEMLHALGGTIMAMVRNKVR